MEALTSLGIDWKLLLAQAINFLIVLVLLWKFLYGPIVNLLEKRKQNIEQGLKDAEEAKKTLEQTNEQTRRLLADATQESEKIVKAAKKEMEIETKQRLDQAQKKAEELVANSKRLAEDEQRKIVEKAKKEISDLAVAISEKILSEKIDKSKAHKAIEQL